MQQAVAEPPKREERAVIARFEFEEERYPLFLSVSSLFTDLLLTHDLAVLLSYPEYADYTFGSPFWTRRGRPIEPEHQLRTVTIVKQSPLVLEILVSAVGGIWALTQIIDKVANWKLTKPCISKRTFFAFSTPRIMILEETKNAERRRSQALARDAGGDAHPCGEAG